MRDLDQVEAESFLLWLTLPFSLFGFLALAAAGWLTSSPTCPEAGRGGGFPSSRQGFSASAPVAPTSGEDDD